MKLISWWNLLSVRHASPPDLLVRDDGHLQLAPHDSFDDDEREGETETESWGPFTNDVSREGEGGGYPITDADREVA